MKNETKPLSRQKKQADAVPNKPSSPQAFDERSAGMDTARARYFDLYDLAPVAYCTVNDKGLILEANFTASTLLGVARGKLVKQLLTRFIFKEDQNVYYLHRKKLFDTGEPQTCELRLLNKNGTQFWAHLVAAAANDEDGMTVCRIVMSDITGIKQTESQREAALELLIQSETRYRLLADHMKDYVWLMDLNLKWTYISPSVEKLLRYTLEELAQLPLDKLLTSASFQTAMDVFSMEMSNTMTVPPSSSLKHLLELECRCKDGRTLWIESTLSFIQDEKGKPLSILGEGRDITERKKVEEELKKYRENLEELVRERTIKLEASNKELEAFSYSASHDLRAPLRSIDGFSQALLEDCEDKLDIQGKDYLIRIRAAIRRMAELIEDLMQLSLITLTEMNIEKVNLTRIARSVIDELQKSQPQRHVEIRIADGLEETADLKLMHIVLENLLGNAWKFTGKQAKAVIEFGFTKEGEKKVYFIRDNGSGFDMAYADKLFAPFQRLHTEEEFPGTGIGLATVRRIIHRHGGKVWTEGQTGKGATFYFSLNEK